MPLLHNNKTVVDQKDAEALKNMLQDNLRNIISRLEYHRDRTAENAPATYDPVIKYYRDGLNALPDMITAAQKSTEELSAVDFIQKVHEDIANKVITTIDPEGEYYGDITNVLFSDIGGTVYPKKIFDIDPEERDLQENYKKQEDTFVLADAPMEGVENIAEYKPESGRVIDLYENRSGNSNTLSQNIEELQQTADRNKNNRDKQAYEKALKDIEDAKKAPVGLHAGAEYARIRSSEMMAKDHISFADVYETFTTMNKMVRPGDPDAGTLRGTCMSAGDLKGPGSAAIPSHTYQTLQTIADNMNKIKQTEDPALRKTQAIQLAAFAYQMTLSEHVFSDANGRTCRMFADSILQTFGLPPHTPSKAETEIPRTIGEGMDFKKGADVFLDCVKQSDLKLKEAAKDPEAAKKRLISKMPEKKISQEETSLKLSAIYEVSEDSVEMLRNLKNSAKKAKGRFRDSKEYKAFSAAIDKSYALAGKIMQNKDKIDFDLKQAEAEYSSSIRKLFKSADTYREYKMKDHTKDKTLEPNKKALGKDDKTKLDLVDSVTNDKTLIKVKQPQKGPGPGPIGL